MTKIYDFFSTNENTFPRIETVNSSDLFEEVERDTIAMLELFNLSTKNVDNLSQAELFTLHNALIKVKYFQETGKVLTEKGIK